MGIYHDMMPKSAYSITNNHLKKYREDSYYDAIIVSTGTKFQVIGFYLSKHRKYTGSHYFLVESQNNKKVKAWISNFNFDINTCYPETNTSYTAEYFSPERGTYGEEKIDYKNIKVLP